MSSLGGDEDLLENLTPFKPANEILGQTIKDEHKIFIMDTLEDIEKESEGSEDMFNRTMPRHGRNMT